MMIEFTWYRDNKGYHLIPETPRCDRAHCRQGRVPADLIGLSRYPAFVRQFAEIRKTSTGVLGFIEEFGLLSFDGE